MLNKIKSKFFYAFIFECISEKVKLNIIKYNKSLQKSINIKLLNYKLLSGKYIIKESNEIWKLYNAFNNILIFKGNYLNGKGKEYYLDGKLLSEGEYLNNKKWNLKLYDINGNIISELKDGKGYFNINDEFNGYFFESEFINGLPNGKGKEYYFTNYLKYEGEYLNGKRHGKGKEYYPDGKLLCEGEYLYNKRYNVKGYDLNNNIIYELKKGKGFIKEYNYNKSMYEGNYLYGLKNGKGKEYYKNGKLIFEGEYLNENRNGKGKEYNNKGELIFEGEYLYNYRIKGKQYIKGKLEYEGDYLYNKKYNGKGYDENGNIIYELINGNGKVKEYQFDGKLRFEGEYLNGKRNGKGKEYDICKGLIYEGEYFNGLKNGKGKVYNIKDNLIFEGEYLNGKKHGKGKEYNNNGKLIYEGNYLNGKRENKA